MPILNGQIAMIPRTGRGYGNALHPLCEYASTLPICGTTLTKPQIDYRSFLGKLWEAMPADEYVEMISNPTVLGDLTLKTQHFIGASRWERVSDEEVVGYHQLRVPHQKYTDISLRTVKYKGHAHGTNKHWYRKIDGVWKFAGLAPIIRWAEYDFDKVFANGRDVFAEKQELTMLKAKL